MVKPVRRSAELEQIRKNKALAQEGLKKYGNDPMLRNALENIIKTSDHAIATQENPNARLPSKGLSRGAAEKAQKQYQQIAPEYVEERMAKRDEIQREIDSAIAAQQDPKRRGEIDKARLEDLLKYRDVLDRLHKDPSSISARKAVEKFEKGYLPREEKRKLGIRSIWEPTPSSTEQISNLTPQQEAIQEALGIKGAPNLLKLNEQAMQQAQQSPLQNVFGSDIANLLGAVAPSYLVGATQKPSEFGRGESYNPTTSALLGGLLGTLGGKGYDLWSQRGGNARPQMEPTSELEQTLQGLRNASMAKQGQQEIPIQRERALPYNRTRDILSRLGF